MEAIGMNKHLRLRYLWGRIRNDLLPEQPGPWSG